MAQNIELAGSIISPDGTALEGLIVRYVSDGVQKATTLSDSNGNWTLSVAGFSETGEVQILNGTDKTYLKTTDKVAFTIVDTEKLRLRHPTSRTDAITLYTSTAETKDIDVSQLPTLPITTLTLTSLVSDEVVVQNPSSTANKVKFTNTGTDGAVTIDLKDHNVTLNLENLEIRNPSSTANKVKFTNTGTDGVKTVDFKDFSSSYKFYKVRTYDNFSSTATDGANEQYEPWTTNSNNWSFTHNENKAPVSVVWTVYKTNGYSKSNESGHIDVSGFREISYYKAPAQSVSIYASKKTTMVAPSSATKGTTDWNSGENRLYWYRVTALFEV